MANVGEIAARIARRFCEQDHLGATPCMRCAEIRYIALSSMEEYLTILVEELQRHK